MSVFKVKMEQMKQKFVPKKLFDSSNNRLYSINYNQPFLKKKHYEQIPQTLFPVETFLLIYSGKKVKIENLTNKFLT